jgi:single-strand DNA-binding protein
MNNVVLIGRLTKDVELKYIQGTGTPVANFAIAVDREFTGKDGKKEVDFIDIQVWGKSAENCSNYIGKGSLVGVQGSIRIDLYQNKEGENRKITRVNANRVQFLDTKNNKVNHQGFELSFEPSFEPTGLDPQGFQAIDNDNDDIPF